MSPAVEIGETPPGYADDWEITHIGRRAKWGSGVEACAVCETSVDLSTTHRYVTIGKLERGISRPVSTDEFIFCSSACYDRWL